MGGEGDMLREPAKPLPETVLFGFDVCRLIDFPHRDFGQG
jgi:hypothetical protein